MLNKKLLLENFNSIVTSNDLKQNELRSFDSESTPYNKLFKNKYHIVHSSGSTGTPGYMEYHADMNYIEFEQERTYITSLYNFTQPLIRYELSDKIVQKKDRKNSRYPLSPINNIWGRDEDIM